MGLFASFLEFLFNIKALEICRNWVVLTPHVASLTIPGTASEFVIDNIRRHEAGQPLLHVVDPDQGY